MLNQIFRDFDQKNLNHFLGQTSPIFGANKYEKKAKFRLQISGLLTQIMGLWVQISIEFVQLRFQQLRVLEYFCIHGTVFRNVPALKNNFFKWHWIHSQLHFCLPTDVSQQLGCWPRWHHDHIRRTHFTRFSCKKSFWLQTLFSSKSCWKRALIILVNTLSLRLRCFPLAGSATRHWTMALRSQLSLGRFVKDKNFTQCLSGPAKVMTTIYEWIFMNNASL